MYGGSKFCAYLIARIKMSKCEKNSKVMKTYIYTEEIFSFLSHSNELIG